MQSASTDAGVLLIVLDLVGIFVFAISGGLVAVRKDLDVFGVLVIGAIPPAALADWRYLLVPVVAGALTFWFHPALGRMERLVNVFDAAGLALFCVTGALKALAFGLGPVPAALMGMLTGIGGGMLRDVLAGRVPIVFRGELYATPALVGAAVAVVGSEAGLPDAVVAVPAALVCLLWRLLAMRRGWNAPRPSGAAST